MSGQGAGGGGVICIHWDLRWNWSVKPGRSSACWPLWTGSTNTGLSPALQLMSEDAEVCDKSDTLSHISGEKLKSPEFSVRVLLLWWGFTLAITFWLTAPASSFCPAGRYKIHKDSKRKLEKGKGLCGYRRLVTLTASDISISQIVLRRLGNADPFFLISAFIDFRSSTFWNVCTPMFCLDSRGHLPSQKNSLLHLPTTKLWTSGDQATPPAPHLCGTHFPTSRGLLRQGILKKGLKTFPF